jgi:putative transposase
MPVMDMVLDVRSKLPGVGGRKLYHLLKPELEVRSIKLGRDGLFSYLRAHRLLIRRKRRYTQTTDSKHWLRKYPNLYAAMNLTGPEQALVSDITYVESREGVHYLSLVTDAYSRKIMGHELSRDLAAVHTARALKAALRNCSRHQNLIHHSDRGVQYCAAEYQQVLKEHGVTPSMTDGYDCYQNALAERVNGILKQEFLGMTCNTFSELGKLIRESVQAYNELRPHLSLGMQTPEQVHNNKVGGLRPPALV